METNTSENIHHSNQSNGMIDQNKKKTGPSPQHQIGCCESNCGSPDPCLFMVAIKRKTIINYITDSLSAVYTYIREQYQYERTQSRATYTPTCNRLIRMCSESLADIQKPRHWSAVCFFRSLLCSTNYRSLSD